MKTTLVCIVPGELSSGELLIAYEFAHRLPSDKYQVYFVASPRGQLYLEKNGMKCVVLRNLFDDCDKNIEIFDDLVKTVKPDYFLVSDVYTVEFASSWSGITFERLRSYGVPIIGVDEYEYPHTNYTLDLYAGLPKNLPPLIDMCDYLVRNCPLNKLQAESERIHFFSLYERAFHSTSQSRKELRQQLGTPAGQKIVFIANSNWENLNVNHLPALGTLLKWVPQILAGSLQAVREPLTVIHVGPTEWRLDGLSGQHLHYLHFDFISPIDFDRYLLNSDLFITTNLVSVTLSKAIFGAVPSIVFQNQKIVDFSKVQERLLSMPAWYRQMAEDVKIAHPFRLFPFGWYNFLKTVMAQNPYQDAYVEVPLFKYSTVVETLGKYLFDEPAIAQLKQKQHTYVDRLMELPSPHEILTCWTYA